MEIFDNRYYKSCKYILELIGLWPYQNYYRRRACYCIVYLLHSYLFVPLIIKLYEVRNLEVVVENSVSSLFLLICNLKYSICYVNAPRFKILFAQISKDWQKMKDINELEILIKSAEDGRIAVIIYIVYIFLAWAVFNLLPFLPPVLDIIYPLKNGSHPVMLPFHANYIIFDQLDHHYEICIHALFVYFFGSCLFAGIDSMYVATVKHASGLFGIARLETVAKRKSDDSYELKLDSIVRRDLTKAIILHNETIKFSNTRCCSLLEDSFSICILIIQSIIVCAIALGAYYIVQIYNNAYKLIRCTSFFFGTVLHLMYIHWVGQQIIDSSEKVFNSAYFSDWYLMSVNARKLTNIIMIRRLYPSQLTAGKMSSLSIETFGKVMKTSMSYFTVLLSLEK